MESERTQDFWLFKPIIKTVLRKKSTGNKSKNKLTGLHQTKTEASAQQRK